MTYRTTLGILSASVALALAGTVQAQAPAAPTTTPAPATQAAPQAAPATPPAAAPKSGTQAPKTQSGKTKGRTPTGNTAPTGTPGVAAVPGQPPSGSAKAGKDARAKAPEGAEPRQLHTAYSNLMTPEEMAVHSKKVKQTKTYAECRTLFDATAKDMEARAKAQNKTIKATPTELCDRAKERGRVTG